MTLALDKSVRHDLERLAAEFDRCARTYKPLFHERLSAWSVRGHELLTETQWLTFKIANPEPLSLFGFGWWCWNGPWVISGDEELMGRFTGYHEGLTEFLELSNTASALIAEFVPEEIQGVGGYDGWLHLMHRTALLYPSKLLEVKQTLWNQDENDNRTWDTIASEWVMNDGVTIPKHPVVHRLKFNVFSSSSAFMRMILNPQSIRTWEGPVEGFPANVVWDHDDKLGVGLSSTETPSPSESVHVPNLWRKKGDYYEVRFDSGPNVDPVPIEARYLGCDHIIRLIEHAGKPVPVFQFLSSSKGRPMRPVASTIPKDEREGETFNETDATDFTFDEEAEEKIRKSIEEAKHREEVARSAGNFESADEEAEKWRELERYLKRDTNHRNRPRRLGTSEVEKKRKAVRNALTYTFSRLKEKGLGRLADHFEVSIRWIWQGRCYAYLPSTSITWQTATGNYSVKGIC